MDHTIIQNQRILTSKHQHACLHAALYKHQQNEAEPGSLLAHCGYLETSEENEKGKSHDV